MRNKQIHHKMIGMNTPLAVHARIKSIYQSMPKGQRPKRMSDFCVSLMCLGLDALEGKQTFKEIQRRTYNMKVHRLQTFNEPKGLCQNNTTKS